MEQQPVHSEQVQTTETKSNVIEKLGIEVDEMVHELQAVISSTEQDLSEIKPELGVHDEHSLFLQREMCAVVERFCSDALGSLSAAAAARLTDARGYLKDLGSESVGSHSWEKAVSAGQLIRTTYELEKNCVRLLNELLTLQKSLETQLNLREHAMQETRSDLNKGQASAEVRGSVLSKAVVRSEEMVALYYRFQDTITAKLNEAAEARNKMVDWQLKFEEMVKQAAAGSFQLNAASVKPDAK